MNEIKNEEIDCTITSPPYGRLKKYGTENENIGNFSGDLQVEMLSKVFKEVYRTTKDGGFCCINIGEYIDKFGMFLYPFQAKLTLSMIDTGWKYFRNIIWNKKNNTAQIIGDTKTNNHYFLGTEPILIFRKFINYNKNTKGANVEQELRLNVWDIAPYIKKEDEHIAIYPKELVRRLMILYSKEKDFILDPFLGSGTTLEVAKELNRNGYGYEIVEKYYDLAKNKLNEEQKRLI